MSLSPFLIAPPFTTDAPEDVAPVGLVQVTVVPCRRENCLVLGVRVDFLDDEEELVASTGHRLGVRQLLAVPPDINLSARAAVKDGNGLWTKWGGTSAYNLAETMRGGDQGSIGSGASIDLSIQSPGIWFPDLSRGSGRMTVRRTLVSSGFFEEVRQARWTRSRAAFRVKLDDLDEWQTLLLHRFWRGLNGPQRAFFFDFAPPEEGTRLTTPTRRYLVQFQDEKIQSGLFTVDRSEMEFTLLEVMEDCEGGEV